ncbi:2,4-dienoyl-CoA reductase-like NADH-dependent reductase (Old Yellow Enzyme family) [Chitinophaga dinghuensis]|uniref:2,4-dienoyl-CoA reductase-like NADH-dependent reductase (Old Yellow Enzyme family) n=1 Tax=Chitinophaga dinghuensis TaxID=1539050 RepID=A0A327VZ48_9BACT|nr:NADH:flavin oxidoreductase/NADH oxidase [Chitinophaga dinghuensis]RAJ82317.1 2,4-dienoyl-CoA reductase-like NADH-dependent reductase (Old Yellow Enzyme family) [Chitinophaga dinghuensis]
MIHLFQPLQLRSITLKNRIAVSPMCEYSSEDGFANDWHLVHLGSRAVGGAALVLTEAAAVSPEGRISPQDLGIWKEEHLTMLQRITQFIKAQGAVPGIQLAHAGRKASTYRPWDGNKAVPPDQGGWTAVAPSAIPFNEVYPMPEALTLEGIRKVIHDFATAAERAIRAGFEVIELHGAHGYLIHSFLSPLSNQRSDNYGGSFENRIRLILEITAAVRAVIPQQYPLLVRISATDWTPGGWTPEESVKLAAVLKEEGVDLIDTSSGGLSKDQKIPVGPLYQVPFAEQIKRETGIPTGAVGLITTSTEANEIIADGRADLVLMARELLRDPYFPLRAAAELDFQDMTWPIQYVRAKRTRK